MKILPTMDDEFVALYSELTTEPPDPVKFRGASYTSGPIADSRITTAGYRCTGDLDYPAAKSLNVISPVSKESIDDGSIPSSHSSFGKTANKIFTRELLSSRIVNKSRVESMSNYGINSFDEDLLKCVRAEEKNQRKTEKTFGIDKTGSATTTFRTKVRFSSITIQEYPLQPGNNPGGTKGCPLTIGWEPISTETLGLDIFENARCHNRRNKEQLKLVSEHREHLLLEMGYTKKEIMASTKIAGQARRGRFQTIAQLKSSKSHEKLEGIRNNVQNFVTFGRKKRRERKFLARYKEPGDECFPLETIKS